MLGLDNSYIAWCFNNAVYHFGQSLENELHTWDGKKGEAQRKQTVIRRWLTDMPGPKYRDPMSLKEPQTE